MAWSSLPLPLSTWHLFPPGGKGSPGCLCSAGLWIGPPCHGGVCLVVLEWLLIRSSEEWAYMDPLQLLCWDGWVAFICWMGVWEASLVLILLSWVCSWFISSYHLSSGRFSFGCFLCCFEGCSGDKQGDQVCHLVWNWGVLLHSEEWHRATHGCGGKWNWPRARGWGLVFLHHHLWHTIGGGVENSCQVF